MVDLLSSARCSNQNFTVHTVKTNCTKCPSTREKQKPEVAKCRPDKYIMNEALVESISEIYPIKYKKEILSFSHLAVSTHS